jgi:hypothetical protein
MAASSSGDNPRLPSSALFTFAATSGRGQQSATKYGRTMDFFRPHQLNRIAAAREHPVPTTTPTVL